MANVCDNKFFIFSELSLEKISKKLSSEFEDRLYEGCITYEDEDVIEGYFESNWVFPMDLFEDFFNEFNDDSIYMRCLSEEYGCNYVAMNVYVDNHWKPEQTFDF